MNLFCEHESCSAEHDVGSSFTVSHASGSLCCLSVVKLDGIYLVPPENTSSFICTDILFDRQVFLDLVAAVTENSLVYV